MAMEAVMEGLSACECPVCFLLLSERRLPMSMPCGHTLCQVCVGQLADQATATANTLGQQPQPTFACPLCRQWINAGSVKLNVTLRDLLGELSRLNSPRTVPMGMQLNVNYEEIVFLGMLDRGAFGEVHRAKWKGDEVAVKIFASGQLTPEAMQAFQREVFVMNCLRHPNVVLLMGACQTPPRLAILMEFIPGGSLHKLLHIDKVRLPLPHVAQLGMDICRGLQYLHSINVLHRDLKSKNVLLTGAPPCQAKLCDFGLARMRQESATMTGNVGTVHWTAPEILNNQRYQFPADIYSFGMVLYEMAFRKVPFHQMIPMAVMLAVVINKQQPEIPVDAHPELVGLIRSCTRWNPAERLSVALVLSALTELLPSAPPRQEEGGVASGGTPPLMHQDSLGVVFVEATDTADLQEQDTGLQQLLRANQLNQPNQSNQSPDAEVLQLLSETGPHELVTGRFKQSELSDQQMSDYELALRVQEETRRQQELSDFELAEQMQIRENTFLAPKEDATLSKQPPQPLLDSIKSRLVKKSKVKKMAAKTVVQEPEAVKPAAMKRSVLDSSRSTKPQPPLPPPLPHKKTAASATSSRKKTVDPLMSSKKTAASPMSSLSKKTVDPLTSSRKKMAASPMSSLSKKTVDPLTSSKKTAASPTSFLSKKTVDSFTSSVSKTSSKISAAMTSSFAKKKAADPVSPAKPPQPALPQPPQSAVSKTVSLRSGESHAVKSVSKTKTKSKAVTSSVGTPPPSPLPPPPPPPVPPLRHKYAIMSPRQHMLAQVRHSASTVISKLRHVETVEKRPFRLGRVVGGYSSEQSQFTFQNHLTTFNRRLLHHVDVEEPPPAFPVGRVIDSRHQSNRVKRMSSLIDTQLSVSSNSSDAASPQGIPAPPPPPPRRKLHLSIAAAIEHFSRSKLQHVEPVVKLTLPDATTIARERAMSARDDESPPTTAAAAAVAGGDDEEAFLEPAGYLQLDHTPPVSVQVHQHYLMEKFGRIWFKKTFNLKYPDNKKVRRLQLMEKYAALWLSKTRAALQLVEASHVHALHQAAHSEIERFDRSWLRHVEPLVRQTLPDGKTLVQERAGYKAAQKRQLSAAPTVPTPVLVRQPSSPSGLEELDVLDLLPDENTKLSGEWGSGDEFEAGGESNPKCVIS